MHPVLSRAHSNRFALRSACSPHAAGCDRRDGFVGSRTPEPPNPLEPPRTPEPTNPPLELPNLRITLARSVRNEGASTLQQFSGDHSRAPCRMFHVKHSFPYALRPAGCGCAWASSVISSSGGMDFMGTAVQSIVRSCRRMASLSCALSLAGRGSVDVETGRGAASGREDGGWRQRGA